MSLDTFSMESGGVVVSTDYTNFSNLDESVTGYQDVIQDALADVDRLFSMADNINKSMSYDDQSEALIQIFELNRTLDRVITLTCSKLQMYSQLLLHSQFGNMGAISKLYEIQDILLAKGVDINNLPMEGIESCAIVSKIAANTVYDYDDNKSLRNSIFTPSQLTQTFFNTSREQLFSKQSRTTGIRHGIDDYMRPCDTYNSGPGVVGTFSQCSKVILTTLYDAQCIVYDDPKSPAISTMIQRCAVAVVNLIAHCCAQLIVSAAQAYNHLKSVELARVMAEYAPILCKQALNDVPDAVPAFEE